MKSLKKSVALLQSIILARSKWLMSLAGSVTKKAIALSKVSGAILSKVHKCLLNTFSGEYYRVRLLRPYMSTAGYLCLIAILYIVLFALPYNIFSNFSYINLGEQNIAIVTVMLTVMLSAGFVFLGDDTKGWSLARITIIRDVVKLRGLITAVILICTLSILPDIPVSSYTLKEISAPILVASYLFILSIFIRIYRWLSDLAADPRLFDNESDSVSRTFPSRSYRFARIVYLIRHNKHSRVDVWQSILERKIPEGYEEFIHQDFFNACEEMIRSGKTERLQELSLLLEIYEKYYQLRNHDSWRFEYEYLSKFLYLYDKIYDTLHVDRPHDVKLAVLWRGQSAIEGVIAEQVRSLMTGHKIYSLFKAMDEYADAANLVQPRKQGKNQTKVLTIFINTLLDTLYEDKNLSTYDVESWVDSRKNWQITYTSLFEDKNNVTIQLWKHFEEWLYAKLDIYERRTKAKKEYLLALDGIIGLLFPEVDPIDFSRLYWFKYNAKNTTDSKFIAKLMYEADRPFGHIGRMDIELTSGDKDDSLRRFAERQKKLQQAGVKLFAHLSANYFRSGFWNINEIIHELSLVISEKDEDDDNAHNAAALINQLESIKKELKI